jgi:hypothetical protein
LSNYLSQLARASGLGLEPRPRQTPAPGVAGGSRLGERATHDPLHAERVLFVEQPRRASRREETAEHAADEATREGRDGGDSRARHREDSGDFARESRVPDVPGAPGRVQSFSQGDVSLPARPGEGRVRLFGPDTAGRRPPTHEENHPPENLARLSADRADTSDASREPPPAAHTRPTQDRAPKQTPASKDDAVLVAPRVEAGASREAEAPREAPPSASGDAGHTQSQNTEEARPAFLREIIEWISAPPTARAEDGGAREGVGYVERARGQAGAGVSDEAEHARVRAEAERGPEVDDFTLSIGSIHVVVEEPAGQSRIQPAPPAPSAASPSRGRGSGASDGGGSRLRRHYIRV